MFKIGIVGSRRRDTEADLQATEIVFLNVLHDRGIGKERVHIISGGCPQGGDRFAEVIAKKYQHSITIHYPRWKIEGRGAGYTRNELVVKESDLIIACLSKDSRSFGTENTIKHMINLNKEVVLVE